MDAPVPVKYVVSWEGCFFSCAGGDMTFYEGGMTLWSVIVTCGSEEMVSLYTARYWNSAITILKHFTIVTIIVLTGPWMLFFCVEQVK